MSPEGLTSSEEEGADWVSESDKRDRTSSRSKRRRRRMKRMCKK
jgi:hypothetical protein